MIKKISKAKKETLMKHLNAGTAEIVECDSLAAFSNWYMNRDKSRPLFLVRLPSTGKNKKGC